VLFTSLFNHAVPETMRKTFLAWNRVNSLYFVTFYLVLLAAAQWSGLSFFHSIPFTFVGIGVVLSLILSRVQEEHLTLVLWRLYGGIFSIMFLAILAYPFMENSRMIWLLTPGAWLAWTVIMGCVLIAARPSEEKKSHKSREMSPKARMVMMQLIGLGIGLFVYGRSAQYGLPAVIMAVLIAIVVIVYSFFALNEN